MESSADAEAFVLPTAIACRLAIAAPIDAVVPPDDAAVFEQEIAVHITAQIITKTDNNFAFITF